MLRTMGSVSVKLIASLCFAGRLVALGSADKGVVREKRNVLFPSGSAMGLYMALALPVDLPQYEISMSFNFEANYDLPSNATELTLGPYYTKVRKGRSLTRENVYSYIEDQIESRGHSGRTCLLRTICETQAKPIAEHNGLVGDLVRILFTPSSSATENSLSADYGEAEAAGRHGEETCVRLYGKCALDMYDLFTVWSG